MKELRRMGVGLVGLMLAASGCGDDDANLTDAGPGTDSGGPDDSGGAIDSGGSGDGGSNVDGGTDGTTYTFASRFNVGESSVNHAGQTTRNLLILDLKAEMERIATEVRSGGIAPTAVDEVGEVLAFVNALYLDGTAALGTRALPSLVEMGDTTCQTTYADLGDSNLFDKVAGEDDSTDHLDWDGDDAGSTGPEFAGWTSTAELTLPAGGTVGTPVGLVAAFFETFEAQVRACALNAADCPQGPGGADLPLYVTPEGLDLAQLVQKFLLGAINFHQGTDDYLDDEAEDTDKGLINDNTMARGTGEPDTALEHAWDEGFGYFGAAVNYGAYTDDEIRADSGRPEYQNGYNDFDGNACIDVFDEYNFAASVNAAKRDAGSTTMTDITAQAFEAFVAGRTLIAEAGGNLTPAQQTELEGHRDLAVEAWEQAIAATAIHYINDVRADMANCGTMEYSFTDHAKHWSELKGFALSFQFNPRSPFNTATYDFAALHTSIGDAPVLCAGDTTTYAATLLTVRNTIRDAYGFDATDAEGW